MSELRVSLTADDFDTAIRFWRDGVGLPVVQEWGDEENGVGVVLAAGMATLELLDTRHAAYVDRIEGARAPSGRVRLAVSVDDVDGTGERLRGSTVVGPAVTTPWGDRNVRVDAPDGLQLTLFAAEAPPA